MIQVNLLRLDQLIFYGGSMKLFFFILILLKSTIGWTQQRPLVAAEVLGNWKLSSMIYEGNEMDLPNPDLQLSFTFFPNHSMRIYWDRKNPEVFCESHSNWTLQTDNPEKVQLILDTYALNPLNASDCSLDPDMTLGKKDPTAVWRQENKLMILLRLGDQNLIYVFEQQNKEIL